MKVFFSHCVDEASNIKTFYFRPEKTVHFTAGQFTEWTLKHANPDNRGDKRWFTISSTPTDELISLTTKIASKPSTFKKSLLELKSGDEILISEPMGDFVLPKLIQTPLIFVAGGIGITPFHSILSWLKETKEQRPIKLLHGVNSEDEIIFHELISKSDIQSTIVVNQPSSSWGGERGYISAELILGLEKPSDDTLIYVSGPEPMVEKLEKELISSGIKKHQFVGDYFPNYTDI